MGAMSFNEAVAFCERNGGVVFEPHSLEEELAVAEQIQPDNPDLTTDAWFWIGVQKDGSGG